MTTVAPLLRKLFAMAKPIPLVYAHLKDQSAKPEYIREPVF